MNVKKIIQTIKKAKTILISAHVNPDPDALCSELALAIFLKKLGKKVFIVNDEALPARFNFFPGANQIISYQKNQNIQYDVAIILDCGELNRIGKVQEMLLKDKPIINIDHHTTNDNFGTLNLVDPHCSSTAELLYELIRACKVRLTSDMAYHLYIGIMTDTGSFRYENTTSRTHEIIADLMRFKFSVTEIYRLIYDTISFNDLREFAKVVSTFEVLMDERVILLSLTKDTLKKFSESFDLRDAIFKYLRSVKGVEVVVIFTEAEKNKTRINLRSVQHIDVAAMAKHFGGGGHKRASGCQIDKNVKGARQDVLKILKGLL